MPSQLVTQHGVCSGSLQQQKLGNLICWREECFYVCTDRFCLTLAGEARLRYQSIHPFQGNWKESQERFRVQVSKIGSTQEQLFHEWRIFHLNENAKTIDAYVQSIWKAAAMLNYGEKQTPKVFKNTLLSYLYWILFQNDNLR